MRINSDTIKKKNNPPDCSIYLPKAKWNIGKLKITLLPDDLTKFLEDNKRLPWFSIERMIGYKLKFYSFITLV